MKTSNFKGYVLISGASTGIGKACAIHLDNLGYHVFAGVRKTEDGDRLKQETSERLQPIFLDVTNEASIIDSVETVKVLAATDGLTGLINNAGIAIGGPLEFLPLSELRKVLEVNVIGQIAVTQAFIPLLRKAKGRIINMSSINGKVALPFHGPYSASKFALEAITDSLRIELEPWDIGVSLIEPGVVKTPIWKKTISKSEDLWKECPQKFHNLYSSSTYTTLEKAAELSKGGVSAEDVAKVVACILTAKKMKPRYLVGVDAKILSVVTKITPDNILDKLKMKLLGLS